MRFLEGSGLRVSVLDPVADRARLGSRYCCGGYVWQVEDAVSGSLLSGPAYPGEPRTFDGQGLPEVFEIALGQDKAAVGDDVWVIGVGKVKRESSVRPFHVRDNPSVSAFADWETVVGETALTLFSRQSFGGFDLNLIRRLELRGRTLESFTFVENLGKENLPIRWFAHPFFPWAGPAEDHAKCFRFSLEASFPENPAYAWGNDGFVERKPGYAWDRGFFQPVALPFGYPLQIIQKHPLLGEITVACRFPVAWLPIWGNDRTISCEPYFHTVLPPGAKTEWSIAYGF